MTKYYESQNRNAQACSFAGNGTVNSNAPSSTALDSAVSQCLANTDTTFTPTTPATNSNGGSSSGSGSGSGSNGSSGSSNSALGFSDLKTGAFGMTIIFAVALASGFMTLA